MGREADRGTEREADSFPETEATKERDVVIVAGVAVALNVDCVRVS